MSTKLYNKHEKRITRYCTWLQDNKILYMITRLQGIVHEYKTTRYYTWLQDFKILYIITRKHGIVHEYKNTRCCTSGCLRGLGWGTLAESTWNPFSSAT